MNELRRKAIGLLARREHGRAELARKLAAHGTEEEIAHVLAELEAEGLLSDARAAAAYVRAHGARFGAARLRQDLRSRGLDPATAAAEVGELPSEVERAQAVWSKKFSAVPGDAREWARQARFLRSRGFATDVIRRLLKDVRE
ncbi:MAG: recombination regulator RecX [Rhodocyclaceae bacterium]|nr:recombination regulator RecX [Rhodocyclaceae bacterium]MBK6554500.1 recombination regulator RecX [Rhodocyclaceae bacterium]MBK6677560.1 recombination regulator RecX [Rhodocyclaceae bacterium]MBK9310220.1 recombination regulator RecX [Rhodocyclaceae bacterium]